MVLGWCHCRCSGWCSLGSGNRWPYRSLVCSSASAFCWRSCFDWCSSCYNSSLGWLHQSAREVSEFFRKNEDMPPIDNVKKIPFSETNLGLYKMIILLCPFYLRQLVIPVNLLIITKQHTLSSARTYHETNHISSDKRFVFPSVDELYSQKVRNFEFSLSIYNISGEQGVEIRNSNPYGNNFDFLHDERDQKN